MNHINYSDMNRGRLAAARATIKKGLADITAQGVLGYKDGHCCNRFDRDGKSYGCIVGLLVGVEKFAEGSTDGADFLSDDLISRAYRNSVSDCEDCNSRWDVPAWENLSREDQGAYKSVLQTLQSMHDLQESWGFKSADLFIMILSCLNAYLLRISQPTCDNTEVPPFTFTIDFGNYHNFSDPQKTIGILIVAIQKFVIKK